VFNPQRSGKSDHIMIPNKEPTTIRKMNHRLTLASATALLLSTQLGCPQSTGMPSPSQSAAGPMQVVTVVVVNQDLLHTAVMPGTVVGEETTDIYAKVGGFLQAIGVEIGDSVAKGDVLAVLSIPEMAQELERLEAVAASARAIIDQSLAGVTQAKAHVQSSQAAIEEAETESAEKQANLKFRKAELDRTKELVEKKALLAKRLDEARFNVEAATAALGTVAARVRTAKANLTAAHANVEKAKTDHTSAVAKAKVADLEIQKTQTMIAYGTLRAPFDGVITKRMVDPGAFIKPADGNSAAMPLLTISRIDTVRLLIDLPMKEVRWLDVGDEVVFDRINVLPGEKIPGKVTRFSAALDSTSRMLRVEIDLPNDERKLSPGYFGYVTIQLEEFKDTPVIPSTALTVIDDLTYVFVVKGTTCHKRLITTNYRDGVIVGIESGVKAGEQVVKTGIGQLTDGQEVKPVLAENE
jgi:RND family efflux transporter MFP subunit